MTRKEEEHYMNFCKDVVECIEARRHFEDRFQVATDEELKELGEKALKMEEDLLKRAKTGYLFFNSRKLFAPLMKFEET